jgi:hypothetical protein
MVLGVDPTASPAEIRNAYHQTALKFDPTAEADRCCAVARAYQALRSRSPSSEIATGVDYAKQLDAFRKTAALFCVAVGPVVAAKHLVVKDLAPETRDETFYAACNCCPPAASGEGNLTCTVCSCSFVESRALACTGDGCDSVMCNTCLSEWAVKRHCEPGAQVCMHAAYAPCSTASDLFGPSAC